MLVLCIAAVATVALRQSTDASAANGYDFYRWPWRYGHQWTFTQTWGGATSHTSASGLYYAIDVRLDQTSQPVHAAAQGSATCYSNSGLGTYVRIVHGSDSSIYAHLNSCFTGTVSVLQGQQIGWSGTTGNVTGLHLHFQVNTTTTGTTSKSFTMSGVTPPIAPAGSDCPCPSYTSDNLEAGYSLALVVDSGLRSKYVATGGWSVVGSTAKLGTGWTPGRSTSDTTCGSGPIAGRYNCTKNGYGGSIQTFKGVGAGQGEHAIFRRSSGGTAFMGRGPLKGYAASWDAYGRDGLWYMGYPTGDWYVHGSDRKQDFQNGYLIHYLGTCQTKYWYWDAFLGQYINQYTQNSNCN